MTSTAAVTAPASASASASNDAAATVAPKLSRVQFEPKGASDLHLLTADTDGLQCEFLVHMHVLAASSKWARALLDVAQSDRKESQQQQKSKKRKIKQDDTDSHQVEAEPRSGVDASALTAATAAAAAAAPVDKLDSIDKQDSHDSTSHKSNPLRVQVPDTVSCEELTDYLQYVYMTSIPSTDSIMRVCRAAFYADSSSVLRQCEAYLCDRIELDKVKMQLRYLDLLLLSDKCHFAKLRRCVMPCIRRHTASIFKEPHAHQNWSQLCSSTTLELMQGAIDCSVRPRNDAIDLLLTGLHGDVIRAEREAMHRDTELSVSAHLGEAMKRVLRIKSIIGEEDEEDEE